MKSIMEEASTIAKAIENAWTRAGNPQSFEVKIYEEPQKNFFGLTTKPAKVGIFFLETAVAKEKKKPIVAPPRKNQQPIVEPQPTTTKEPEKRGPWSEEMVDTACEWIEQALSLLGKPEISFTATTTGRHLKFNFEQPLVQDSQKEKFLFSSFAYLIMATLRNKFKKGFRELKIVLTSQ